MDPQIRTRPDQDRKYLKMFSRTGPDRDQKNQIFGADQTRTQAKFESFGPELRIEPD